MEDLKNSKWFALCISVVTLVALAVPLVGTAVANHPSDSCLDVRHEGVSATQAGEDESADNPVGSNHTVTAYLRDYIPASGLPDTTCDEADQSENLATNPGPSGINIDFEINGVNDPDSSTTPETPDRTCVILPGQSSCSIEYQGTVTGSDTIRGWIDHDGSDQSQGGQTEADKAETENEKSAAGMGTGCPGLGPQGQNSQPEPDCTDVVTKTWTAGPPASLDCDDPNGPDTERETNPSQAGDSSSETYTCTIRDASGNPTTNRGVTVFGEIENSVNDPDTEGAEGPSYETPDRRCNASNTGQCNITIGQVDGEVGTAEICFWVEEQTADDYSFTDQEMPDNGGDAAHCGGESTGEDQLANGSDTADDLADQVEKTWEARRAAAVDAEPESDTNQPGENHSITATVYDQFGNPFSGNTTVNFEFFQGSPTDTDGNTPSSPDKTCTTQSSNSCSTQPYTSQEEGLDRICVFIGQAPAMSGDSSNGTCDGDSLNETDDTDGSADAPEGSDDQDVVQKRWGAAGTATRLDCSPETDTNPTGTSHTVTCTARDSQNGTVQGTRIDAEATGANDPDNGDSQDTPDFTCTTNASGDCSFTHGSPGTGTTNSTGETTYRAWIDEDNDNATGEADRNEGQNESAAAGSEGEPDNTDVVTKTWTGDARRIDCEPETDTNPTGTNHTVTCTVYDNQGRTVGGEGVTFTESGPGQFVGSSTATTDQNGRVSATTTSSEAGTQTITGTLNDDTTGGEPNEVDECDKAANDPQGAPAGECSDSVTKTWTQADPECSDDVDNDGDGRVDHPSDPGCDSAQDNDETDEEPVVERGPCAGHPQNSSTPIQGGNGNVVVGSPQDDVLTGTDGDDIICALGGDDVVTALGGNDQVLGGGGNDQIDGGGGKDQLSGNAGNDSVSGRDGNDSLVGGRGRDTLKGNGGIDTLRGNGGTDTLQGGSGADTLTGGADDDLLRGGTDNDTLEGGRGDDVMRGGKGRDLCRGGPGRDRSFSCERH